ncbi:MAG: T9SS type A sorting domain-containing protein [Candidatus Marinimicrobia bacterium]|nr:T9SS type A sorting domain-containing protein [Candidatus Neomarinimicrobiota bacterium]
MRYLKQIVVLVVLAAATFAQWPTSPDSAIYVGSGRYKRVVEDGQGGVYIVNGSDHAYCTRINHQGEKVWEQIPLDGDYHETKHNSAAIASDSSLLISYRDMLFIGSTETGDAHIRVQKISHEGGKLWGEGVVVTPDNASGTNDNYPRSVWSYAIGDDAGGAYVAWTDRRNDATQLYLQRISSDGEIMWDSLGVYLDAGVSQIKYITLSNNHDVLIIYVTISQNGAYHYNAQIVDPFGTPLFGETPHDFNLVPTAHFFLNGSDRLFYTNGTDRVFQLDLNFEHIWPEEGIAFSDSSDFIWSLALDQSGGVILQYQKDDFSNRNFSQWIENNGSLKFGSSGLFFSTSDVEHVTTTMSNPESFIVTYQDWYNYSAQSIDSNGNLLWPDNTLIHSYNHYTSHWQNSVSDTEGGIICVLDYNYSTYATQMGPDGNVGSITSIVEPKRMPSTHILISAYPNPFNPSTTIEYDLPEHSDVSLIIYDVAGREVQTLVSTSQSPGSYKASWNGTNKNGQQVAGGMYFARLQAGEYSSVVKMVYLR